MTAAGEAEITRLLEEARQGSTQAADDLVPLVYERLRAMARRRMAMESPGHTLEATVLVHDADARLVGNPGLEWHSRAAFFGAAAEAMRRLLIDHARHRKVRASAESARRLECGLDLSRDETVSNALALEEALQRFEKMSPGSSRVVRLRFYAGLSLDQCAGVLGVSSRTVKRQWAYARAWLYDELDEDR